MADTKTSDVDLRIWKTIAAIPEGKVCSYGVIADLAGLPGRARLVGKRMGCVPESWNLPWQRVLRSTGQIAFPSGSEKAQTQRELLQVEGVEVANNRVSMKRYLWQPSLADMLFVLEN